MYKILVSRTFQKQFHALDTEIQTRIKNSLGNLQEDPLSSRSGADIKPLVHTNPQKYRLRVGQYRIIYRLQDDTVMIIEMFRRGRDYRE
jgi:mRNA interferase RelE/StbE